MPHLRQALERKGFSVEAVEIALSSVSDRTRRNYSYCWNRWMAFSEDEGFDCFDPPLPCYLDFLTREYKQKGTGSSVNHAMTVVGGALKLLERNVNEEPMAIAFRQWQ